MLRTFAKAASDLAHFFFAFSFFLFHTGLRRPGGVKGVSDPLSIFLLLPYNSNSGIWWSPTYFTIVLTFLTP